MNFLKLLSDGSQFPAIGERTTSTFQSHVEFKGNTNKTGFGALALLVFLLHGLQSLFNVLLPFRVQALVFNRFRYNGNGNKFLQLFDNEAFLLLYTLFLLGRGQDLELVVLDSLNIGFLDGHAKDKVAGHSLGCGLSGVNPQSEIVMSQGQGTGGVHGHGGGEHEHVEGVVVVHGEPFNDGSHINIARFGAELGEQMKSSHLTKDCFQFLELFSRFDEFFVGRQADGSEIFNLLDGSERMNMMVNQVSQFVHLFIQLNCQFDVLLGQVSADLDSGGQVVDDRVIKGCQGHLFGEGDDSTNPSGDLGIEEDSGGHLDFRFGQSTHNLQFGVQTSHNGHVQFHFDGQAHVGGDEGHDGGEVQGVLGDQPVLLAVQLGLDQGAGILEKVVELLLQFRHGHFKDVSKDGGGFQNPQVGGHGDLVGLAGLDVQLLDHLLPFGMHTFFDFLDDDFMLLLNSLTRVQGGQEFSQIVIDIFQTFEATSSGDEVKSVLGQKVVKLDPDIPSQERLLIGDPAAKELVSGFDFRHVVTNVEAGRDKSESQRSFLDQGVDHLNFFGQ